MTRYKWDYSQFVKTPIGYWDDPKNHRSFMDNLAKKWNIKDQQGWYDVTAVKVKESGGFSLVQKCGSLVKLLSSVYPEYQARINNQSAVHFVKPKQSFGFTKWTADWSLITYYSLVDYTTCSSIIYHWEPSKFVRVPSKFWTHFTNQRSFMDQIATQLSIFPLSPFLSLFLILQILWIGMEYHYSNFMHSEEEDY